MGEVLMPLALLEELNRLKKRRDYLTIVEKIAATGEKVWRREPEVGYYLAVALLNLVRSREGLDLTDELQKLTCASGDHKLSRRISLLRGAFLSREGRLQEAEESIRTSMIGASWSEPSRFAAEANNTLGIIQSMRGDWNHAIPQLHRALTLFEQLGDRRGVGQLNHNIGVAHRYWGQCEKAEQYFARSAVYYMRFGTPEELTFTQAERSLGILGMGNVKLAEAMARRALARCEALDNSELMAETLRVLGTILREGGQLADAEAVLTRAFSFAKLTRSAQLRAELHEECALLRRQLGQDDAASRHQSKASKHYRKIGAFGFDRRLSERMSPPVYAVEL